MSDINFDCPLCRQNLDAPVDMAGLFIECPACQKIIKVPPKAAQQGPVQWSPTVKMSTGPVASPPSPELTPQEQAEQDQKSATIPIKLPPNLGVPQRQQRKIIIKRSDP